MARNPPRAGRSQRAVVLRASGTTSRDGGQERSEAGMLPPRLIRRLVLAPLAIVVAMAIVVLFPLLALVALTFGAVGRSRPGRMRVLRLLFFGLVWLTVETAAL